MTKEIIFAMLAGIILWQFIITILCQFNLSEDALLGIAICFWVVPIKVINRILSKITLAASRRYNCYLFYGDVSKSKLDNKADCAYTNFYMTPKAAAEFKQVSRDAAPESWSIRILREGKEFKSAPHKTDILTIQDIAKGKNGYTPEFLSKFLKPDSKWKAS